MRQVAPRKLFKDESKLSFDYVPEKLVHRDRQLDKLWMIFRPVLEGAMSQTAFLIGNVGTGKTATSKRFCIDLKKQASEQGRVIDYIIINCRQRNSESAVLQRLVTHFDEHYPDRGFSIAEMLRAIRKHLEKNKMHLVIVLDEADILIRKGASDLIYQLSRFDEETVGARPSLSLILVSQKYVLDLLDPAAFSTFRRANAIQFDKYNAEELRDIIAERVELAFHQGMVRRDSIDLVADIASEWGDARFAIELLDRAGMMAEEETAPSVAPEHVRAAKALTYSIVTESKVDMLDRQRKIVLLAVARAMRDEAYVTTGDAEKVYKVVAEEYSEKPRAHTQFWAYIQAIANEGIVQTKVSGDAAGGRTTYISIPDVPTKVLKEMLEKMLSAE